MGNPHLATAAALAVLVPLAMPGGVPSAGARTVYRWQDSQGVHYSNVPERIPPGATEVTTAIGRITTPARRPSREPPADQRTRAERAAIRRRLAEIESFYASLRRRQEERLRRLYPGSTILADWQAGDRWLRLKEEEGLLRRRLECLGYPPVGGPQGAGRER